MLHQTTARRAPSQNEQKTTDTSLHEEFHVTDNRRCFVGSSKQLREMSV